jgi:hypothetical protein
MGSIWADPEDDVKGAKIPSDPHLSPVDYLLARLRDPQTERLSARDRIAIALLPFTVPKLQATATIQMGQDFASKLDRACLRSDNVRLLPPTGFKRRV